MSVAEYRHFRFGPQRNIQIRVTNQQTAEIVSDELVSDILDLHIPFSPHTLRNVRIDESRLETQEENVQLPLRIIENGNVAWDFGREFVFDFDLRKGPVLYVGNDNHHFEVFVDKSKIWVTHKRGTTKRTLGAKIPPKESRVRVGISKQHVWTQFLNDQDINALQFDSITNWAADPDSNGFISAVYRNLFVYAGFEFEGYTFEATRIGKIIRDTVPKLQVQETQGGLPPTKIKFKSKPPEVTGRVSFCEFEFNDMQGDDNDEWYTLSDMTKSPKWFVSENVVSIRHKESETPKLENWNFQILRTIDKQLIKKEVKIMQNPNYNLIVGVLKDFYYGTIQNCVFVSLDRKRITFHFGMKNFNTGRNVLHHTFKNTYYDENSTVVVESDGANLRVFFDGNLEIQREFQHEAPFITHPSMRVLNGGTSQKEYCSVIEIDSVLYVGGGEFKYKTDEMIVCDSL